MILALCWLPYRFSTRCIFSWLSCSLDYQNSVYITQNTFSHTFCLLGMYKLITQSFLDTDKFYFCKTQPTNFSNIVYLKQKKTIEKSFLFHTIHILIQIWISSHWTCWFCNDNFICLFGTVLGNTISIKNIWKRLFNN